MKNSITRTIYIDSFKTLVRPHTNYIDLLKVFLKFLPDSKFPSFFWKEILEGMASLGHCVKHLLISANANSTEIGHSSGAFLPGVCKCSG